MAPEPDAESPVVIHAWSAPRSLSTSLMYSFAQVGPPPSFPVLFAPQRILRLERGDHKRMGTRCSARALAQLQRKMISVFQREGLW